MYKMAYMPIKDLDQTEHNDHAGKPRMSMPTEPRHEISNNVVYATSKGSDQPAHSRSLIRAFANRLNILWHLSY